MIARFFSASCAHSFVAAIFCFVLLRARERERMLLFRIDSKTVHALAVLLWIVHACASLCMRAPCV